MTIELESEIEGLGLNALGVPVADLGCVFKCGLKAFVNHTEGVHAGFASMRASRSETLMSRVPFIL